MSDQTKKWVDKRGNNLTSQEVCERLEQTCGQAYSTEMLEKTFPVGAIAPVSGVWTEPCFQRLA